MKSTLTTNRQMVEEQHRKEIERLYSVDQTAVDELTKAVANSPPEKVQKRSGHVRSSWGSKL